MKPIFLELPAVAAALALSESTLKKEVREGRFPKPRQISARRVAWLVREIEAWAEGRPISDLPPPLNTGNQLREK